ncbi:hypothetical protein BC832DRAFT_590232 [Gaertneriomyces semiglobifer]|nr:hypothetical protein BC832DRAFT_590232 [Gaertneriomyces semiglobifer]
MFRGSVLLRAASRPSPTIVRGVMPGIPQSPTSNANATAPMTVAAKRQGQLFAVGLAIASIITLFTGYHIQKVSEAITVMSEEWKEKMQETETRMRQLELQVASLQAIQRGQTEARGTPESKPKTTKGWLR